MTLDETIRAVQSKLGVAVDGKPGPQTWSAIYLRVVGPITPAVDTPPSGAVDARSEATIVTLHPRVQPYARALIQRAADRGITIKAISGTRTYPEQDALYAQGRTKPGDVVTNARGGYSSHNFGTAFDIGVFSGSKYIPESSAYHAVGVIGKELGLSWGGDWTTSDEPHHYLKPDWANGLSESQMMAGLRARHADNRDAFSVG